jgi:hypothetical protein
VHLHILWIAGGLSLDGTAWRSLPPGCCLPPKKLRREFRDRFLAGLERAQARGALVLTGRHGHLVSPARWAPWLAKLRAVDWNVYAAPVELGGRGEGLTPAEAARRTVGYLAAYASGTALHNDRLLALEDDQVEFSYKDYYDRARRKRAWLPALELIDRFLLHILPRHVRHIRNYGFLAPNQRGTKLPLIRRLLGLAAAEGAAAAGDEPRLPEDEDAAQGAELVRPCPVCHTGVLREGTWPRPTIAQIMQLPLTQLRQYRLPFQ